MAIFCATGTAGAGLGVGCNNIDDDGLGVCTGPVDANRAFKSLLLLIGLEVETLDLRAGAKSNRSALLDTDGGGATGAGVCDWLLVVLGVQSNATVFSGVARALVLSLDGDERYTDDGPRPRLWAALSTGGANTNPVGPFLSGVLGWRTPPDGADDGISLGVTSDAWNSDSDSDPSLSTPSNATSSNVDML